MLETGNATHRGEPGGGHSRSFSAVRNTPVGFWINPKPQSQPQALNPQPSNLNISTVKGTPPRLGATPPPTLKFVLTERSDDWGLGCWGLGILGVGFSVYGSALGGYREPKTLVSCLCFRKMSSSSTMDNGPEPETR